MKTTIELAREAAGDDWRLFRDFLPEIHKLAELVRNATLDEIASKIALMPFGDTAASFAVWIKEQKQ